MMESIIKYSFVIIASGFRTDKEVSNDRLLNRIRTKFGEPENIVIEIGDWSNKNTIMWNKRIVRLRVKKTN